MPSTKRFIIGNIQEFATYLLQSFFCVLFFLYVVFANVGNDGSNVRAVSYNVGGLEMPDKRADIEMMNR